MKKNTLNITWGGEGLQHVEQGSKESFRTKTLESATNILDKRNKSNILSATFTNSEGKSEVIYTKPII